MSENIPDIEVARYALRSFDTSRGKLGSLYQSTTWDGGTAVARCLTAKHCASPPGDDCTCGLYGTLSLQQLVRDYRSRARHCVVVFAAEGPTIIGDKGLRTSAARIVAYWCARELPHMRGPLAEVFAAQCPNARHFIEMDEMLSAYRFEPMPEFGEQERWREHREQTIRALGGLTYLRRSSWENVSPLLSAASPGGIAALKGLLEVTSSS